MYATTTTKNNDNKQTNTLLALDLSASGRSHTGSLTHTPALFMTSNILISRNKMAALADVCVYFGVML